MQNNSVGMTRALYFEMCEAIGSTPIEEEIPIELEDLSTEIRTILDLYRQLEDRFSEFSGSYMGKSYIGFPPLHEMFCPDLDKVFCLSILRYIDSLRLEESIAKNKQRTNQKKKPGE